jgi:hypothetical protein
MPATRDSVKINLFSAYSQEINRRIVGYTGDIKFNNLSGLPGLQLHLADVVDQGGADF